MVRKKNISLFTSPLQVGQVVIALKVYASDAHVPCISTVHW